MDFFEVIGKITTVVGALFGLYWTFEKWRKREEHFPRINFDLDVEIIDHKNNQIIVYITAVLENKGHVPLKINDFICQLRGIKVGDSLELGDDSIRNQLNFKHKLGGGVFIPVDWDYSFVYPNVKSNYTFVTIIPNDTAYLLVKGVFHYFPSEESHHAGKILKIEKPPIEGGKGF